MFNLSTYQAQLESLEVELNRETYRQYAGLPYDEARMSALSREIEQLAVEALQAIPPQEFPRPLLFATIRNSRASDYTRLDNEIYRRRSEEVALHDEGEEVSLSNWRLFNHRYARDPRRRRRVFLGLLERAAILSPLLAERFTLSRQVTGLYGWTPLDIYLEEESVDLAALERLVEQTAAAARPHFARELQHYAEALLGASPEFFDDYYVFLNVIYEPVDRFFREVDFDRLLRPICEGLGFSFAQIAIDTSTRPGKHASPVCFGVRIPGEVYVLYQRTSPVADYTGYCHELGHALHFASVSPERSYVDRYLIPAGVAELFSTLFESLGTTPQFLADEVGLPSATIDDLVARERFMELYFLTFYGANSLFKLRYWRDVPDMDAADRLYADLYRRYVGLPMPGRYWQTHHVLAMHDVYAPSYLLAKVRMVELRRVLQERFSPRWWRHAGAGRFLREEMMAPGRALPLEVFSRLDAAPYLRGLGLSPAEDQAPPA